MRATPVRSVGDGFTLVELLVVIGVIGLLASLLLPVVAEGPKLARRRQCASNLRQIAHAARIYAGNFDGSLPDLFAGIPTDFARQESRYRLSHYARNSVGSEEVPCGLWILVVCKFLEAPNVLFCPDTPAPRRLHGTQNPKANDIPQMAGYAYNYFPDSIPSTSPTPPIPPPPGVLLGEAGNDYNHTRAQRFYALLADVFVAESQMAHDPREGLNCVYWDSSVQWVDLSARQIPWNAVESIPGEGATRTFSDDLDGYKAVRDTWVLLSEARR